MTLSGTLDAGLEKTASGQPLQLQNGRSGTSNFTLAGTEDLGGGMKARFQVSTAFDSTFDNGIAATPTNTNGRREGLGSATKLGDNGMFLALDGGFGSIVLGRPMNTLYSFSYTANGTKGVTGYAATNSITPAGIYTANAIQYVTPDLGGFTAQLEYAPSEVSGVTSSRAVGLKYATGPLAASLVYDQARALVAGGDNATRIIQLAGAYDFGVAKVSATYQRMRPSSAAGGGFAPAPAAPNTPIPYNSDARNAFLLGLNVPMGPGALWAQYGVAQAVGTDARIVGLGYKYSLSKRTLAYLNLGHRNTSGTPAFAGQVTPSNGTGYGIGLQHNF